jgi:hypothetical protein
MKGWIVFNMLWYQTSIHVTFGTKQAYKIYQILFVYTSTICDIITKLMYHFWHLLKPQEAHHKIYKTTRVYIEKKKKKKLCLRHKHLVIFWVISIGHADYFVFPIVTQDWLCFVHLLFMKCSIVVTCQHVIVIPNRHTCYFWYKTGIQNKPNIVCVQRYHFWYLLKPQGAYREIYKKNRSIYWK